MKHMISLVLALVLLFSCTACGGQQFGKEAAAQVPETETVTVGTEDGGSAEVEYLSTVRVGLQLDAGWPQMRLLDTSVTASFCGSILQLTGLDDVGGYSYTVQSIDNHDDGCEIQMESSGGGMTDHRLDSASVMLRILPEGEENPWECFGIPYAPAGEIVHQEDESNSNWHRDCLILEQTEETLCFVADEGRMDRGVPATFLICIRLYDGYFLEARVEHALFNPSSGSLSENDPYRDETLREPLRETAEDLLRNATVILHPAPEDAAKLLPRELQFWNGSKRFSKEPLMTLPCSEILQVGYDDDQRSVVRFRSVDADGAPAIITMTHIARMLFDEVDTVQANAWLDAYKANKKSPDPAMSAYLGVDAVAVDGGWVLHFGTTDARDNYEQQQPLCVYLSIEPATEETALS